ncbi:MAG TPA: xanthine dehydrogenase family protein molybdopterin-binding subunit [Burkholderiales bacterium]|nr:xanthine dehydrogenase family protein molybdopterin-binding subunit [Burkholderiales bacterium]
MSAAPEYLQPGKSQWIGKPVRRLEDQHLMTGRGRFTDDVTLPNLAHCAFARSPHAHARIARIDTVAARNAPGVLAVFTGADLIADGVNPLPFAQMHKRPDGSPIVAPPRYPLTADAARFVGNAFAMVIAETRNQAKDGAELVEVEWEELPAIVEAVDAARADAPKHWEPAFAPEYGNIAAIYRVGDLAKVDAAFAAARKVVSIHIVNNRIVSNPIEPKAAIATYDAATQSFTLWCPTQNTHLMLAQLAESVLKVPKDKFRVICGDLGGGFGTRVWPYPEYAAVAYAARKVGRPVKWLADRSETFLSDAHGRDHVSEASVAIDAEHRFTAMRIRTYANVGAYLSNFGAAVPAMSGARAPTGVYRIPLLHQEVRMMFTNTGPVDAYRGAGRPEAGYLVERLVSRAAIELGLDQAELRRRNAVRRADIPYKNAVGSTFDSGDFAGVLEKALAAADWNGFPARKSAAKKRGLLAGRGIGCYVEVTGSANLSETVDVTVTGDGRVIVVSGTQSMGTGLWTAYAQIVAERLGVAPETVTLIQGDTSIVKTGGGSGGSRSLQVGGGAVLAGANATVETGRKLAAAALEAAEGDIEFRAGRFVIGGTDRGIGLFELAKRQPEAKFVASGSETAKDQTWPNGCQVAEVEIDPETGVVSVTRHVAVDDIGRVMNPLIAHGQIEGGIVQGIGQALVERTVYDPDSGQLLTGSLADYAMPRADDVPDLVCAFDESSPTAFNVLGAKGVGESGVHGAVPAVVNAVIDALGELGIREIDMPVTREKVWRAIRDARA